MRHPTYIQFRDAWFGSEVAGLRESFEAGVKAARAIALAPETGAAIAEAVATVRRTAQEHITIVGGDTPHDHARGCAAQTGAMFTLLESSIRAPFLDLLISGGPSAISMMNAAMLYSMGTAVAKEAMRSVGIAHKRVDDNRASSMDRAIVVAGSMPEDEAILLFRRAYSAAMLECHVASAIALLHGIIGAAEDDNSSHTRAGQIVHGLVDAFVKPSANGQAMREAAWRGVVEAEGGRS